MIYKLLALYMFEGFWLLGYFFGGEYPEGVVVPLIMSTLSFIVFLRFKNENLAKSRMVSYITLVMFLMVLLTAVYVLKQGYMYFFENWKGMTYNQFNKMLFSLSVIGFYQLAKLYLLNRKVIK
jgi:hypothetical protein